MKLSCVMVVDDCEPDQFISTVIIENYDSNIVILQAYDGHEALEILDSAKQKPDIIFLDINMPRMDGHEFLEAYEKRDEDKASVVVMLTSSSQEQDKERSMAHRCVKSYLVKPLEISDLEELSKLEV